jgi:hypothetical protein
MQQKSWRFQTFFKIFFPMLFSLYHKKSPEKVNFENNSRKISNSWQQADFLEKFIKNIFPEAQDYSPIIRIAVMARSVARLMVLCCNHPHPD